MSSIFGGNVVGWCIAMVERWLIL